MTTAAVELGNVEGLRREALRLIERATLSAQEVLSPEGDMDERAYRRTLELLLAARMSLKAQRRELDVFRAAAGIETRVKAGK